MERKYRETTRLVLKISAIDRSESIRVHPCRWQSCWENGECLAHGSARQTIMCHDLLHPRDESAAPISGHIEAAILSAMLQCKSYQSEHRLH